MVKKPKQLHIQIVKQLFTDVRLHRAVPSYLSWIYHMIEHNGEEYAVNMLKQYKVLFIALLTNSEADWGWLPRKGSYPKGPLRSVFRVGLTTRNPGTLAKILSILNFGTTFISSKLTREQRSKAINAISGPDYSNQAVVRSVCTQLELKARKFSKMFKKVYKHQFSFAGWNTSKPTFSSKGSHPWVTSFLQSALSSGPHTRLLSDMGVPVNEYMPPSQFTGKVAVLQERGFKARVIAVPTSGIQVAYRPLHLALNNILKSLKTDCTHDQYSGALWAKENLEMGNKLFSIDLSSATDNFPLSLQISVLKGLGYKYTQEFMSTCRGEFETELTDSKSIHYTKGQPMGLYGSFALFGLTHNLLLSHLGASKDEYRIVGDDLIISNEAVAVRYMDLMVDLGVPISYHKSILGKSYAEFAGFIITDKSILKPLKFPNGLLDPYAYVNLVRTLRKHYFQLIPKGFKHYAMHLCSLPEEFGGVGLNPHGLSLIERLKGYYTDLDDVLDTIQNLKGPNAEFAFCFQKLHPLTRGLLEFLDFQSREMEEMVKLKIPDFLKGNQEFSSVYYTQTAIQFSSFRGMSGWDEPISRNAQSIKQAWYASRQSKTVKPVWIK